MITRLAITPGEPAGIGPDTVIQIAQTQQQADLVVFADPELLLARADTLGLPLKILPYHHAQEKSVTPAGTLRVNSVPLKQNITPGKPDTRNAPYVLDTIKLAATSCLESICDGMVTGPVHKGIINQAGFVFSGHTEYLAQLTQSQHVVMMLATEGLRVALVTTHVPLKMVSSHITHELLEQTLRILHKDLKRYFCSNSPVIYVCGLNPHAGENGTMGTEEIDTIIPVIKKLRSENLNIFGPYSADTIFSDTNMRTADVFLAMYHDQGLPILKYKGFNNAVNITLGLNIIRTSVDHGTAFDLAGSGKTDCHSLQLAIDTAINMHKINLVTT